MPVDELKLVSCWEQGRLDSRVAPLTLTVHGMLLQGAQLSLNALSDASGTVMLCIPSGCHCDGELKPV